MTSKGSFEDSTIWPEIKDIIGSKDVLVLYDYKGTLHTAKEDVAVWDLSSVETTRDYLTEIGETSRIIFRLGLGDYVNRVFPYRQNLEFTVKKIPLSSTGDMKAKNGTTAVMRYKAIFNPANNPPVGGSELEAHSAEDLNNTDMVEIHLELVDRSLEPLRIKTTGGSYRKVKAAALIRAILGGESLQVLVDGKPSIHGLDLVEPDNQEVINNVNIKDGTLISAIPTLIQHTTGGVYNRGIGTFFQTFGGKKMWFVYPVYDTERFDSKDKRMIFYSVPQERLPQLDRSYCQLGNVTKVAITAQRKYNDNAELGFMNQGSGFRMADANAFMKKPVVMVDGKPKGSRARLNHEVIIKDRKDGLNYAPVAEGGPSSNPFFQRSAVVARSMAQLDLVWENANPDLIYPGMPCKYIYLSQGKAISLKGTILFVHAFTARVERQNAAAFRTTCRITIACEAQTKIPDLPTTDAVGNNT